MNHCEQRFRKRTGCLNEIKVLMENLGRNVEELNDERWTADLAFLVRECHSNNLSKVLTNCLLAKFPVIREKNSLVVKSSRGP
jgi:hypothetical protein